MKAHMIRVASGGSKSWGKRVRMATTGMMGFMVVREEGACTRRGNGFQWPTDFWWAGTNLDGRAN